jgi:hypothetical protein
MRTVPDWGALRVGGVVVSVCEPVLMAPRPSRSRALRIDSRSGRGYAIEGAQNALPEQGAPRGRSRVRTSPGRADARDAQCGIECAQNALLWASRYRCR